MTIKNSKKAIIAESVKFFNESNSNLIANVEHLSGNIYFNDEWTRSTNKYDDNVTKINNIGIDTLWNTTSNIEYTDGRLTFSDGNNSVGLFDVIKDIPDSSDLNKLNSYGNVYDFQYKNINFRKYVNVKKCLDSTEGFFSLDKLLNDEYSRKQNQDIKSNIYAGTSLEVQNQPYAGILDDSGYQSDGWIDLDYVIYRYFGDVNAYDPEASFSIRTKPIKNAKRIILSVLLEYMSDIYSLNSYNKNVEFSLRVVDRTSGQVLDISHFTNENKKAIGSVLSALYTGKIEYTVEGSVVKPSHNINLNKCDKVYINKCTGELFTLNDFINPSDEECETCEAHNIVVQVKINPSADLRINKPDILNTIDPIHWTTGIDTIDKNNIKEFTDEFGEKTFLCGKLNQNRGFAQGNGSFLDGFIAGGFIHETNDVTKQTLTTETWNGTMWSVGPTLNEPRSLGIGGGNSKYMALFYGVKLNDLNPLYRDDNNKLFLPNECEVYENVSNSAIYDGEMWFTTSSFTVPAPNLKRHSVAGYVEITVDKNEECAVKAELLQNKFIQGEDQQAIDSLKVSGIAFGGSTNGIISINNLSDSDLTDNFEYFNITKTNKFTTSTSGSDSIVNEDTREDGCWLVDPTKKYPVKAIGICYVGNYNQGLATGGKGASTQSELGYVDEEKLNLMYAYVDTSKYNEFKNPVYNLAYEYNGETWLRRDNLPEEVYYHCGVGNSEYATLWGGIHCSLEFPKLYDTVQEFKNWKEMVSSFKGTFHRNGTYGIDGELRYALFPTIFRDDNGYLYYQLGDSRDYVEDDIEDPLYKRLKGTNRSDSIYGEYDQNLVNNIIANKHQIITASITGDNVLIKTYSNGEAWNIPRIISGVSQKKKAVQELNETVGEFYKNNELNPSYYLSLTTPSGGYVNTNSFAMKHNIKNNLEYGYSGHTVQGGMWLFSRPTVGEYLFHPEHYVKINGDTRSDCDYILHSFNTSGCGWTNETLHSFYIQNTGPNVSNEGLQQFIWKEDVVNNRFGFIERWEQPFIASMSGDNEYGIVLNGETVAISSLSNYYNGSLSYGKFNININTLLTPLSGSSKDILENIIFTQFENVEYDYGSGMLTTNMSAFKNWLTSTPNQNLHIQSYDNFTQYFDESTLLATKINKSSSSVRDRAALFPWGDLLNGNSSNKCQLGDITWNWVRFDGNADDTTYLVVAEVTFADYINKDDYIEKTGRFVNTTNYPDKIWREEVTITCYSKEGTVLWVYTINYDEVNCPDFSSYGNTNISGGTLFGSNCISRVLADDESISKSSLFYDETSYRRWNGLTIGHRDESEFELKDEDRHILYINWNKNSSIIPKDNYVQNIGSIYEVAEQGNYYPKEGFLYAGDFKASWMWGVPQQDSQLKSFYVQDSSLMNVYNIDGTLSTLPTSGDPLVKEIISVYNMTYNPNTKFRVSKAVIALPDSNGYIYPNYGKSTLKDFTNTPNFGFTDIDWNGAYEVNSHVTQDVEYLFPWNVLLDNPTAYAELYDETSDTYLIAVGNSSNKKITKESDKHTNIYHIVKMSDDKYKQLFLYNTSGDNGKATVSSYNNGVNVLGNNVKGERLCSAISNIIYSQNGTDLFDLYVTIYEKVENTDPYDTVNISGSIDLPFVIPEGASYLVQNLNMVPDYNMNTITCMAPSNKDDYPIWETHNHEEWTVPYLESPFAGFLSNDDFNIWLQTGEKARWGTPIWSDIDLEGSVWIHYRSQRVGVDYDETRDNETRNKVYLSNLITSINITQYRSCVTEEESNVPTNIPCYVTYDEYIYDYNSYKNEEFVKRILGTFEENCNKSGIVDEKGYVSFDSLDALTNVKRYDLPDGEIDECPRVDYYYTEWATNFIQEFKGRQNNEIDNVPIKYYFKYDNGKLHGSTTMFKDIGSQLKLISTDWRRYQDGVGLGGDAPFINDTNCLQFNRYLIGQTAFGTPTNAVIAGGYSVDEYKELVCSSFPSWFKYYTDNVTFKWNKTVINPEDTLNKNYRNRTFTPVDQNGNTVDAKSNIGYIMFDIGKNVVSERNGSVEFLNTDEVVVEFDTPISSLLINTNYSISMTPSKNIKIWWEEKNENGFIIKSEIPWSGSVDWRVMLVETIDVNNVEQVLDNNQETYDYFNNL